jgi:nucleoside-diphosphate-sugar epimerase
MKKILILGVNGFIGHHLAQRILATTQWHITGMDLRRDKIANLLKNKRFQFYKGDITKRQKWIEQQVRACDVVLPLVAIATPATYVTNPLRVFELDFEANLPIVRACVKHKKRLIFPSTSEVYGMCTDDEFDPDTSQLVLGPINKPRWIYSCAKQMMDRVIWAYGMQQALDFTLFRPFNWIGPGQDDLNAGNPGGARVVTQFLGHIVRGQPLQLVAGGKQRRSFTYIDDGIDALMRIIKNPRGVASGQIYNIGNPGNNLSVRQMATLMLQVARADADLSERAKRVRMIATPALKYYGKGYEDVKNRVPKIDNTCRDLKWQPRTGMREAFEHIYDANRMHFT